MKDDNERYPRMAVSCVVRRDDRYLLVLRGPGPSAGHYAFPGGKVEAGERLEAAALRELREETGLEAGNVRFFRLYDLITHPGDVDPESHFVLAVHLAEVDDKQIAVAGDDAVALGWFAVHEVRDLPVPPSVMHCIDALERIRVAESALPSSKSEHG